jgi:hypothetical protein
LKWATINAALWESIGERKDHGLTLRDIDEIARMASGDSNEVLAVLGLLSRPNSGLLKMEYFTKEDPGNSISKDEIIKQLRAWWREKRSPTMRGDLGQARASSSGLRRRREEIRMNYESNSAAELFDRTKRKAPATLIYNCDHGRGVRVRFYRCS